MHVVLDRVTILANIEPKHAYRRTYFFHLHRSS